MERGREGERERGREGERERGREGERERGREGEREIQQSDTRSTIRACIIINKGMSHKKTDNIIGIF